MAEPRLVVVGARGLLGSAVVRAAAAAGRDVETPRVAWDDVDTAIAQVRALVLDDAAPLQLAWCAGSGVTSSPAEVFVAEREVFSACLAAIAELPEGARAQTTVFLAASAGAVYAGVGNPPYDESSLTAPLVPYGDAKLALEEVLRDGVERAGVRGVAGRITNLYGPGQDLGKGQGLVSVLLARALVGEAASIYVPLETRRDYLYVDDAARMVLRCLTLARTLPAGDCQTKILAHGTSSTIAELLAATEEIIGRPMPVHRGDASLARGQASDLTTRSRVWPEVDAEATTSLLDGMRATYADLRGRESQSVASR